LNTQQPAPISVAIVEDNAEICESLEQIINDAPGFACVGTFRNTATACSKIPRLNPQLVIMDIQMPGASGIVCTAKLKQALPELSIIMFTVFEDAEQIFKALKAGASGYLLKSATPEKLLDALQEIVRGGAPMSEEIARKVIQSFHKPPPTPQSEPLTPREEDVLRLLARGHSAKEIGHQLYISSGTVSNHLKHIYRKLHVRSRVEAVINYLE